MVHIRCAGDGTFKSSKRKYNLIKKLKKKLNKIIGERSYPRNHKGLYYNEQEKNFTATALHPWSLQTRLPYFVFFPGVPPPAKLTTVGRLQSLFSI